MKRVIALIIAITSMALICPVLAQPGASGGGGQGPVASPGRGLRQAAMGRGAAAGLLTATYDPKTVTTVKGAVESLGTLPPAGTRGMATAIRSAVLKTEQGNITVYLSPDWFLNQQKISLKAGDQIEVTGSKAAVSGQPGIIAKELMMGDKTVALRDAKGGSLWPVIQRQPRGSVKNPAQDSGTMNAPEKPQKADVPQK